MLSAPMGRYIPFVKPTKSLARDIPNRRKARSMSLSFPPQLEEELVASCPLPTERRPRSHSDTALLTAPEAVHRRMTEECNTQAAVYGIDLDIDEECLRHARKYLLTDGGDLSKNSPSKDGSAPSFMKKLMNLLHRGSDEKDVKQKCQKELRRQCLEALLKEPSKSCLRHVSLSISDPGMLDEDRAANESPEPLRRKKTVSFSEHMPHIRPPSSFGPRVFTPKQEQSSVAVSKDYPHPSSISVSEICQS